MAAKPLRATKRTTDEKDAELRLAFGTLGMINPFIVITLVGRTSWG
jgi:hypothetical protein